MWIFILIHAAKLDLSQTLSLASAHTERDIVRDPLGQSSSNLQRWWCYMSALSVYGLALILAAKSELSFILLQTFAHTKVIKWRRIDEDGFYHCHHLNRRYVTTQMAPAKSVNHATALWPPFSENMENTPIMITSLYPHDKCQRMPSSALIPNDFVMVLHNFLCGLIFTKITAWWCFTYDMTNSHKSLSFSQCAQTEKHCTNG